MKVMCMLCMRGDGIAAAKRRASVFVLILV